MSSHSKRIGDIGEIKIISKFLEYENINVSKPIGDNCLYDLIADINGKLYRVQVKTTEKVKNGKMQFSICTMNPWKIKRKIYSGDEIDLFAFYCLDNNYCGLAKVSEVGETAFHIRISKPKNNEKLNVHLAEDFDFDKKILTIS